MLVGWIWFLWSKILSAGGCKWKRLRVVIARDRDMLCRVQRNTFTHTHFPQQQQNIRRNHLANEFTRERNADGTNNKNTTFIKYLVMITIKKHSDLKIIQLSAKRVFNEIRKYK